MTSRRIHNDRSHSRSSRSSRSGISSRSGSRHSPLQVSPPIQREIHFKQFVKEFELEEHFEHKDIIDDIQKLSSAKSKEEMRTYLRLLKRFLQFEVKKQFKYIKSIFKPSVVHKHLGILDKILQVMPSLLDKRYPNDVRDFAYMFKKHLKDTQRKISYKSIDLEGIEFPDIYMAHIEEEFEKRYLILMGLFEFYLYQVDRYHNLPLRLVRDTVFFAAPAA